MFLTVYKHTCNILLEAEEVGQAGRKASWV